MLGTTVEGRDRQRPVWLSQNPESTAECSTKGFYLGMNFVLPQALKQIGQLGALRPSLEDNLDTRRICAHADVLRSSRMLTLLLSSALENKIVFMTTTSLSLLQRASRKDDSQSWNRLMQLYAPLLKHWLKRFEVQEADADDIVQEVLSVVSKKLPEFRHRQRQGAFRSWLRNILIIRLKEFWRLRQKRPLATGKSSFLDQLEELEDGHSELSQLWDREHDEYVMKRLLDSVKPRFEPKTWQAFWNQVMEESPANVVAKDLGMSLSSVYVAKSRVLWVLKQESGGLVD